MRASLICIELSWKNRRMFMALAVEFIDDDHPPPLSILRQTQRSGSFWSVKPGQGVFLFNIDLPLDVGPGTFSSAGARIRYVIYGTILFKIGDAKFLVRCCRDVAVTPSISELRKNRLDFDHEIKVFEERTFTPARTGTLKLTASLCRPYWFSGGSAFIHVEIHNGSLYHLGKIRIKLVRYINVYKSSKVSDHEIASTGYPRNPSWTQRKIMAKSELNSGSRWSGLNGDEQDSVTCEIEIPKGQVTVPLGKNSPMTVSHVRDQTLVT
ncbi:hypothetical protein ABW19_dt0207682 [Dactylella cylindrospora]|nr:hypothetical protein ABW19_dt0207682 [Dactylella cylindrospora]